MAKKERSPNPIKIEDAILDFLTGKSIKTNINFGNRKIMSSEEMEEICENINNKQRKQSNIRK